MQPFHKKETPDFSKADVQQSFVQQTHDSKELMQKEFDVNIEEQNLLGQRIRTMQSFLNDLPSSDPQYSMLAIQIQMDQIELDELKRREASLSQKLSD
ncbi:MAG: hypothetical protein KGI83_02810 [Verrucomicrobiota bacterium]|nr:hypothetical protein [Verrucomicrobiota bacterium]